MTDNYVSPPLRKPLRDLCDCGRGPKKAETEMCQACEDDAQDGVVFLDDERALRKVERIYSGDE